MGFEPRTSSRKRCLQRTHEAASRGRAARIRADSKICILLSASWGEGIKLRRLKPSELELLLTWQVDVRQGCISWPRQTRLIKTLLLTWSCWLYGCVPDFHSSFPVGFGLQEGDPSVSTPSRCFFSSQNHEVPGCPVAACICTFAQNPDLKKTEQIFNPANKYLNSWKHYTYLPTYTNIWLK